jgi:hypothetical protein
MPRGVYLLGVGLALVALALAFTDWALSLQSGVTERNVKRIREGMTLAEVEAITGRPADFRCPLTKFGRPIGYGEWNGAGGTMVVDFDEDGCALYARWRVARAGAGSRPAFLARLRAWWGW